MIKRLASRFKINKEINVEDRRNFLKAGAIGAAAAPAVVSTFGQKVASDPLPRSGLYKSAATWGKTISDGHLTQKDMIDYTLENMKSLRKANIKQSRDFLRTAIRSLRKVREGKDSRSHFQHVNYIEPDIYILKLPLTTKYRLQRERNLERDREEAIEEALYRISAVKKYREFMFSKKLINGTVPDLHRFIDNEINDDDIITEEEYIEQLRKDKGKSKSSQWEESDIQVWDPDSFNI